jgi:hypothetical protein
MQVSWKLPKRGRSNCKVPAQVSLFANILNAINAFLQAFHPLFVLESVHIANARMQTSTMAQHLKTHDCFADDYFKKSCSKETLPLSCPSRPTCNLPSVVCMGMPAQNCNMNSCRQIHIHVCTRTHENALHLLQAGLEPFICINRRGNRAVHTSVHAQTPEERH